ncbi:MAG: hypothetical protein ACFB4J_02625 [Elainellaceae cyanobacterium]
MEREQVVGLAAEMTAQMRLIERVYDRLQGRVASGLETAAQLDSAAYQIHNFYCAVEDLLKLVANAFENRIGAGGDWHRTLLLRLSQPVEAVRPALLSEETWMLLNQLRGFRHFVRHGYGAEIEVNQLQVNLDLAVNVWALLPRDVEVFLEQLRQRED